MSEIVKNGRSTCTYASTSWIQSGWYTQTKLNNEAAAAPEFDGLTAFSLISDAHCICDLVMV
jgi:hypothetical protein